MRSLNQWTGIGNLTRDPELKFTPKGTAVCSVTLAMNHSWRTEAGEDKEEVSFVDVKFFGKQAEIVSKYMKKGRQLCVTGRLRQENWEDKQTGAKRSKIVVMGEALFFTQGEKRTESEEGKPAPKPPEALPSDDRDEVPF